MCVKGRSFDGCTARGSLQMTKVKNYSSRVGSGVGLNDFSMKHGSIIIIIITKISAECINIRRSYDLGTTGLDITDRWDR
jgi:hypothetical protein